MAPLCFSMLLSSLAPVSSTASTACFVGCIDVLIHVAISCTLIPPFIIKASIARAIVPGLTIAECLVFASGGGGGVGGWRFIIIYWFAIVTMLIGLFVLEVNSSTHKPNITTTIPTAFKPNHE